MQTGSTAGAEDTGEMLISVSARLTRLYARVLGQLDTALTFRQYRLLQRIRQGHTSMGTLASFGNLTLPTISESIEVLARRGLLVRQDHPTDRRSVVLGLTADGIAAVEAGEAALSEVGAFLLQGVSEGAMTSLHTSLEAIYKAATDCFRALEEEAVQGSSAATVEGKSSAARVGRKA